MQGALTMADEHTSLSGSPLGEVLEDHHKVKENFTLTASPTQALLAKNFV